ncbi:unnamed protein product [Urochloa decumbens]|uniref:mitogen-activated protein kinase kinase kinase n=1 Tax=Urochloa decumbens TaxID=240449 RepID=A0ABC9B5H2_9POAL
MYNYRYTNPWLSAFNSSSPLSASAGVSTRSTLRLLSSCGMEDAVSSSLGAMCPLLKKLELLLAPQYRLRKQVKEGIELLKDDVEDVSSSLMELSMLETPSLRAKCWMEEARELSYAVQDFVEDLILTRTGEDARISPVHSPRIGRVKISGLPRRQKCSTRIASIARFRTLLREASERHQRYQLGTEMKSRGVGDTLEEEQAVPHHALFPASAAIESGCSSSSHVVTPHSQAPPLYGDAAVLVGINESMATLKKMLTTEGDQQLKVVSIVGSTGIGKTTLAKQVYSELRGQFQLCAFVRVTRRPDMTRLLRAILSQIWRHHKPSPDASSVQNLIDSIKEHFRDKRYFIVLDDLWGKEAWDIVCAAFPHGTRSSRIITTTQNVDVALRCCSYVTSNILKMKPLCIDDSRVLFYSRVFGSEQCPDRMKVVSNDIIRTCGGLPLAIINLAGLLARQVECSKLWYHVQDSLCSSLNRGCTDEEILNEILNLSYNALPHSMKTCLLYFTMYPEGYIIWTADLVMQWVAECFINATEEKHKEEIAQSHFDELVNRGMIQPIKVDYNDKVLSCTLHHIVLDFITRKSTDEKFISAVDYSHTRTGLASKFHRLSLHSSSVKYGRQLAGITMSQLRSLSFYGLHKYVPSIVELKFLRVLILQFWDDQNGHKSLNLSIICRLFQLRYLKISCDIAVKLPDKIRELRPLETLEIDARMRAIPSDIVCLPRLLHLCLQGATKLPDGIGRIRSLCTLQYFDLNGNSEKNLRSLGELTNLQHLHLTCSAPLTDEHMNIKLISLVSSLAKLSNLISLTWAPGTLKTAIFFDISRSIALPLVFLQRLELLPPVCLFSRLPNWIGQLHKLQVLNIVLRELPGNDINILKELPALTALLLCIRAALEGTVVFTRMSFPALRFLKFRCSVILLKFMEGAMPELRRIKLCFNANRRNSCGQVLDGIENLLNLQEIVGRIGEPLGADESDRRVEELWLEDAIKKHPRCPRYNIQWIDLVEEESPLRKQNRRLHKDLSGEHVVLEKGYVEDDVNKDAATRVVPQSLPKTHEHNEFGSNWTTCGQQRKAFKEKFQDKNSDETLSFRLNIPARSAPSSGFWSPVQSPRRLSNVEFSSAAISIQDTNVWSARSLWSSDDLMGSSPSSASPDTFAAGQERSPRSSPLRSSVLRSRNPSTPPSPMHPKLFPDNNVSRPDGNVSASFRPLPLPPAYVSQQTNSSHQRVPKVDMPSVSGQWQKGKLLGSGTFGCVYVAMNSHTGALCAMKEINIIPDDAKSVESLKQLEQEIKFLSQFKHENIVQYYGCETTEDRFYIYLEYVHPGSIHKYVHQHCGSLTESVIRNFTSHILKGLAFLHSQKIMHRDIKGANLLVDINGVVKLADFGMAKHLSTAAPNLSLKGTPYWMAPEVVRATLDKSAGYDLAVDIWSLGCTIIEMFTGQPPWSGLEGPAAMFKVLRRDPPIPGNLSPEGKDFLRCCFKRNPAERPTASKLLEHPFIQNSNHYNQHGCTPYNQHGSKAKFAAIKSPDTGHSGARDTIRITAAHSLRLTSMTSTSPAVAGAGGGRGVTTAHRGDRVQEREQESQGNQEHGVDLGGTGGRSPSFTTLAHI